MTQERQIELPPLPSGYTDKHAFAYILHDYARAAVALNAPGWLPVDGDTRGHEGVIVLFHVSSSDYRLGSTNWVADHLVQPYSTGAPKPKEPAYVGTLKMGYTYWMPLPSLPAGPEAA